MVELTEFDSVFFYRETLFSFSIIEVLTEVKLFFGSKVVESGNFSQGARFCYFNLVKGRKEFYFKSSSSYSLNSSLIPLIKAGENYPLDASLRSWNDF